MTQPNTQLIKQKKDVRDLINSEHFKTEIAKVLPKHLTPERMTRVALTAFLKTPALLSCTPESLTNALLICSQAGLEPDGRLAHLIPYGNVCTVIFDWKGIVALALRNGMEAVYGDKVCEADDFVAAVKNGKKEISHTVNYKQARGEAYAYYVVCQRNGVVDFEVMTKEECDAIRSRSKAGRSGPWVSDYDEMAKKTVIRRMSKRWDLLPEIRDVINADDDVPVEIRAPLMKPVFDAPPAETPVGESPELAEEKLPDEREGRDDTKVPPASGNNYVKAVRNLCKMSNVAEGSLLEFLAGVGSTDGSVTTLEELSLYEGGTVLKLVYDQWGGDSGILVKIKGVKGGAV